MANFSLVAAIVCLLLQTCNTVTALSTLQQPATRRQVFGTAAAAALFTTQPALAAPDCFTDCFENCKKLAPKNPEYCRDSCTSYCEQPDREDGLSGSVSAEKGEVGILGGSFGTGTVQKGKDKPPVVSLPGLDFSSDTGKKLLGY